MVDETEEGNLFSALRTREADLEKHLNSGQGEEKKDAAREKAREEARKKLEEEAKKPPGRSAACPSLAATRIPAGPGAEPAQGPPGAGQQDADRAQGREEGKLTVRR
jgi:hypothetical protein